ALSSGGASAPVPTGPWPGPSGGPTRGAVPGPIHSGAGEPGPRSIDERYRKLGGVREVSGADQERVASLPPANGRAPASDLVLLPTGIEELRRRLLSLELEVASLRSMVELNTPLGELAG